MDVTMNNTIKELHLLTNSLVVKYSNQAKKFETLETTRNFDHYFLAYTKQDTFNSYMNYSKQVLINSGIGDPELLESYSTDKNLIPIHLRPRVLIEQRKYIIENFEELNNYYRMLVGLPDIEDENWFYVTKEISEEFAIDIDTPIHKLDTEAIYKLYAIGYIQELLINNPSKLYLNYLGNNKIDIMKARTSPNFSILNVTKSVNNTLYDQFVASYEASREYFVTALYVLELSKTQKYYDNVMAMFIAIMTVQKVMTLSFKNGINRDFYDNESIKMFFDAYKIPFMTALSIEHNRTILRNINKLFRLKGTDRVIYEIATILGFDNMNIFKYYLIKEHKKDEKGKPIFYYKDLPTPTGGTIKVPDYEKMYNLYFNRVSLNEKNIALALTDKNNNISYDKVVIGDPYWWDDEDLNKLIYQTEFNYVETKYISVNIVYKLSKMVFELIYYMKMLQDKKRNTSIFPIFLPKLYADKEFTVFETVIFLFVLLCKRSNLKGEIIHDPTRVFSVQGFNFKANFPKIIEDIHNDPLIDNELITYIENMNMNNPDDIDRLYKNILGFKRFVSRKCSTTNSRDVYDRYMKVYRTLMVSEGMSELFTLPNGNVANTYKEFLKHQNILLYNKVESIETENMDDTISHVLTKLQEYAEDVKYLHTITNTNDNNIEALISLINYFKSYTVDIQQFNILYILDDRILNRLYLLEKCQFESDITPLEHAVVYDTNQVNAQFDFRNKIQFNIQTKHKIYIKMDDKVYVCDKDYLKTIASVGLNESLFDGLYHDSIDNIDVNLMGVNSGFYCIDTIKDMTQQVSYSEKQVLLTMYKSILADMLVKENFLELNTKILSTITETLSLGINVTDKINSSHDSLQKIYLDMYNRLSLGDNFTFQELDAILIDKLLSTVSINPITSIEVNDKANRLYIEVTNKDREILYDKISSILHSITIKTLLQLDDTSINIVYSHIKDNLTMLDRWSWVDLINIIKEKNLLNDRVITHGKFSYQFSLSTFDIINSISDVKRRNILDIKDKIKIIR